MLPKPAFPPSASPRSNRLVVRIGLGLVLWELASTDYTALACLNRHEPLFPLLPFGSSGAVQGLMGWGLPNAGAVLALQIAGLVLLAVALVCPERRALVLGALVSPILLEWNALLFRWQLYDQDVPIALLMIVLVNPWIDWRRAVSRETQSNSDAGRFLFSALVYLGGCYLFAGVSKLETPDWIFNAKLENIYPAVTVWEDIRLPALLEWTAAMTSRVFAAAPWLSVAFAAGTLFLELFWFAGIFSLRARRIIGTLMFSVHVGIYLSSGILFLSWAVMGLALSWARPGRPAGVDVDAGSDIGAVSREGTSAPWENRPAWRRRLPVVAAVGLPLAALFLPHQILDCFPFARYCQFGWTYANLDTAKVPYALGFRRESGGGIEAIPHGCGGFFDFRLAVLAKQEVRSVVESAAKEGATGFENSARLDQLIRALRPRSSNRSVLGILAHPDHQEAAYSPFDPAEVAAFHLLRVHYEIHEDRSVTMTWEDLGEYPTEARPGCQEN